MRRYTLIIFFLLISFTVILFTKKVSAGTLTNVSVTATSYEAGATATYTLTFTTATDVGASPNMVPQVIFPNGYDWTNVSMPADYSVTVNGNPATLNLSSFDVGSGYFGIRLNDPVNAGSTVVVTITDVINPSNGGSYPFQIFRTAFGGGQDIDTPASLPVVNIEFPDRTLNYTAGTGGTLTGTTNQTVANGENGTSVTAVPNAGYRFVEWSDGLTENPRTDTSVTQNISVTAIFELITYTVVNTPSGITIEPEDPDYNLEDGILPDTTIWLFIKDEEGNITGKFQATFNEDIDLSGLAIGRDLENFKAFVHGLGREFTLYIPKKDGDNKVWICPSANSFEAIILGCEGGYYLDESNENVEIINIGELNYWVVSGLTGTGGISAFQTSLAPTGINSQYNYIAIIVLIFATFMISIGIRKLK